MITVIVNGNRQELTKPMGLVEFLEDRKIQPRLIAVAHNGVILRKEDWPNIRLQDGDTLEVVHMVGGG